MAKTSDWNAPRQRDVNSFKPTRPAPAKTRDISDKVEKAQRENILRGGNAGRPAKGGGRAC